MTATAAPPAGAEERPEHPELLIEVADSLTMQPDGDDRIVATHSGLRLTWTRLTPGTRAALLELGTRPMSWAQLVALVADEPEQDAPDRLRIEVDRLLARSLARLRLRDRRGDLLVVHPQGPLARMRLPVAEVRHPVRLSRFPGLHRVDDRLVVDSPLGSFRVELCRSSVAALVVACATPRGQAELAAGDLDPAAVDATVRVLVAAGVLAETSADGRLAEDDDPLLRQREPQDLRFHAHSRSGLTQGPLGGTYRFRDELPPTPAIRPAADLPTVALPRPAGEPAGPGLWDVVRERRSVRAHGERPITVQQLGEFLHRVARADNVLEADPAGGRPYGVSDRPYPSGGQTYDLELYLTVRECEGLPPGMYRYLPVEHALQRLPVPLLLRRRLLRDAHTANGEVEPQVLITLASRFTRLSWKYEGIAYATTLKNAGVLYELMYLAATALRLAPCGLGLGNSAVFNQAIGVPVAEESAVGEFMLGSLPGS